MKNAKKPKISHTPKSSKGMGDYYGTGIKAKVGKMRRDSMHMQQVASGDLKKSPKALA